MVTLKLHDLPAVFDCLSLILFGLDPSNSKHTKRSVALNNNLTIHIIDRVKTKLLSSYISKSNFQHSPCSFRIWLQPLVQYIFKTILYLLKIILLNILSVLKSKFNSNPTSFQLAAYFLVTYLLRSLIVGVPSSMGHKWQWRWGQYTI